MRLFGRLFPGDNHKLFARHLFDRGNFSLAVRSPIFTKDVVEPDLGLLRPRQRIPGIDGLGLAAHQTPIETADVLLLEDRQVGCEEAVIAARHEFRAD